MSGGKGKCLRCVDADNPVGLAAGFGRKVKVVVIAPRTQMFQSFPDSHVGKAAYPKPHERLATLQIGIDIAENEFPFTPRIRSDDDAFGHAEEFLDDTELFRDARIGLVLLAVPDLPGQKDE